MQKPLPELRLDGLKRGAAIPFTFDGCVMTACSGESIAAALLANGVRSARRSVQDSPRGYYCGMGVCWECIVAVEGRGHVRACMEPVTNGLVVTSVIASPNGAHHD